MSLHPFKVDDKTFVVGINSADDLPKVYERTVVRVSAKQLEIHGIGGRVIHRPVITIDSSVKESSERWSPIVFATAEEALAMYVDLRQSEIDRAKRRIEDQTRLRNHARMLLQKLQLRLS